MRPSRDANGYRNFDEAELHKLVFVGRARSLGFAIEDCRVLLSLYEDQSRESAEVKAIAETHLDSIDRKIKELERLRACLSDLVVNCNGDARPDCPIIDALSISYADPDSRAREVSKGRRLANGRSDGNAIV